VYGKYSIRCIVFVVVNRWNWSDCCSISTLKI